MNEGNQQHAWNWELAVIGPAAGDSNEEECDILELG